MAFACLASLAIFTGGLAAWSAIMLYKGRGSQDRKRLRKVVAEEPKEEPLEQLA